MDPVTLSLLMAGAGTVSGMMGNAQKAKQAKAQMMVRAAEQQAAPWTGMAAQTQANFDQGGPGNVLQGAISGYGAGQSINSASDQAETNKKMLEMQQQSLDQQGARDNAWLMMNSKQLPAANYRRFG